MLREFQRTNHFNEVQVWHEHVRQKLLYLYSNLLYGVCLLTSVVGDSLAVEGNVEVAADEDLVELKLGTNHHQIISAA